MAGSIKHNFTSAMPDGTTPGMLEPSHWNAEHNISGLQETLIAGTNITIAGNTISLKPTGATGSFTAGANTITVVNGIITSIA